MKLLEKVIEISSNLIHLVMTFIKIMIKRFLTKLYLREIILNIKILMNKQIFFQIKIHFKKPL
jgi:hypothetical protein